MTRLLNTPDIGRLTAWVDSSSGDMLAGLSKCPIRKMPPGFWANAALADANPTRSEPAAASTRGPLFISEYLLFKEAGFECPPFSGPLIGPTIYRSIAGGTRHRGCRRHGRRPAERAVDLADRTTARFKADEPEGDRSQDVPEGEIVEAGNQRIECRLRLDVVGRAGDQGQPRRADELPEIANAVDKTHAAAAQPPGPQLAHIGTDDRVVATAKKALQQQHDVKHRHAEDE